MGIPGLCTFIDSKDIYESFDIYGKKIIVDGCALIYQLHYQQQITYGFGGNYNEYANVVRKFFERLIDLKTTPIVVFNGIYETSLEEIEKRKNRLNKRLKCIVRYLNGDSHGPFCPLNHYEVFKDILLELEITQVQCDFGGDDQIAALANQCKCPVLSDDSDFYVYNLSHGFIRFSYLNKILSEEKSSNTACKIYKIENFLAKYSLCDSHLLSLFSALVGNEYVRSEFFETFNKAQFGTIKNDFIETLKWLKGYKTLNAAKEDVLKHYCGSQKTDIENKIDLIVNNYEIKNAEGERLRNILNGISLKCNKDIIENSKLQTLCDKPLPEEFIIAFHKGCVPSSMLNIINGYPIFLHSQIEEFSKPSSHACSFNIRQVIYSILLKHDPHIPEKHQKYCRNMVKEYDRPNENIGESMVLTFVKIRSDIKINGSTSLPIPKLSEVYQQPVYDMKIFVAKILSVDENFLRDIPNHLQLLLSCIVYWLLNSDPKPSKAFVTALLICILYFEMKRKSQRISNEEVEEEKENKLPSPVIFENFGEYIKKPSSSQYIDVTIVHSYSQLQTCIVNANNLNSIVNRPFDSSKLCLSLNGTLIYNLTKKLQSESNYLSFVTTLFEGEEGIIGCFRNYTDKINQKLPSHYFEE